MERQRHERRQNNEAQQQLSSESICSKEKERQNEAQRERKRLGFKHELGAFKCQACRAGQAARFAEDVGT